MKYRLVLLFVVNCICSALFAKQFPNPTPSPAQDSTAQDVITCPTVKVTLTSSQYLGNAVLGAPAFADCASQCPGNFRYMTPFVFTPKGEVFITSKPNSDTAGSTIVIPNQCRSAFTQGLVEYFATGSAVNIYYWLAPPSNFAGSAGEFYPWPCSDQQSNDKMYSQASSSYDSMTVRYYPASGVGFELDFDNQNCNASRKVVCACWN